MLHSKRSIIVGHRKRSMPHLPLNIQRTAPPSLTESLPYNGDTDEQPTVSHLSPFFLQSLKEHRHPQIVKVHHRSPGTLDHLYADYSYHHPYASKYSPMIRQVAMQRLKAISRTWYLLPFIPFTMNQDHARLSIDISQTQPYKLSQAYAAIKEQITIADCEQSRLYGTAGYSSSPSSAALLEASPTSSRIGRNKFLSTRGNLKRVVIGFSIFSSCSNQWQNASRIDHSCE